MTQQHHTVIVGQVGQGKTTTTAELLASMRLQPGRIATGEVRGEASELLKAWNTGHAGGIVSTAAAGLPGVMRRLDLFDIPEIKMPEEGGGK